jgi:hypothetical protein
MVHNKNTLLDAGEIKYVDDVKRMKPKYIIEFEEKLREARDICNRHEFMFKDAIDGKIQFNNREEFIRAGELIEKYEEMRKDEFLEKFINFPNFDYMFAKGSEAIAKYMGVIPFMPCVMINISPNWKGKFGEDPFCDEMMKEKFMEVIDKYLKAANRYSRYKYCLECGSEGNHLHAHIVAELNKGTEKSVMTHLNKGNHAIDLRKIWDKTFPKGMQGCLKGKYAVQRIILRNELLRDDKLKYLIEENKPEGHKNKEDLEILVSVGF